MNYVDLGLPSGTLWADTNEEGYYTFDEAKEKFGNSLPTTGQWQELIDNCEWLWDFKKKQMVAIGSNGNKIILPAAGYRNDTDIFSVWSYGYYWSSYFNMGNPRRACGVYFNFNDVGMNDYYRYNAQSVRLIKNKE